MRRSSPTIGERFGHWTVREVLPSRKGKCRVKAECDCGQILEHDYVTLKRGDGTTCCRECRMTNRVPAQKILDRYPAIGREFGDRVVIEIIPREKGSLRLWVICRCVCGYESRVEVVKLMKGGGERCRQCSGQANATHGETRGYLQGLPRSPEYRAYLSMKARCYNTKNKDYKYYGALGVRIADEWLGEGGFERWLTHVGRKPSADLSIDRYPDPAGNYEPGNVRWATKFQQTHNTRVSRKKTHCKYGHPFDEENTRVDVTGRRHCRTCDARLSERAA